MNVLLDTHTLIWALLDSGKLSNAVKAILEEPQSDVHVSSISFWEISLKYSLGRLQLGGIEPDEVPLAATQSGFRILPLDGDSASSFYRLPREEHRDPFDRMLVWQAIQHKLVLVSKDKALDGYRDQGLKRVW